MRKVIIGLVAAAALVGGGFFAWIWFSGGSGEPSTDVTAPPLASDSTRAETTAATDSDTTQAPDTSLTDTTGNDGGARTFVIDGTQSTARFELDEILRGEDNRVVGTTGEVAGQFRFDPSDLSSAEVSEIVVNARTFETDSTSRDRAIRSPIMLASGSDEHELITFVPTSIDGLPQTAEVGDTVSFTITGDLTIKGTTQEETFDIEVTWEADDRLSGVATTTVDRTDYGIDIPDVPFVAEVSEQVMLALEIVATPG